MGHDEKHSAKHEYTGDDPIVPANIGEHGVAELDAGGQVTADPKDHASRHENGGGDEISIAGLSGEAADPQPPKSHDNTAHSTNYEPEFSKNTAFNKDFGTGSGEVCEGDDSRLSDDRNDPDAIHDDVAAEISAIGTSLTGADADVLIAEDADAGTPFSKAKLTLLNLYNYIKAKTDTLYAGLTHASRHISGGADSIKLDDLAAPDDNTDLDASTSKHGLLKKLGGGTTNFLRADGTWAAPPGGSSIFGNQYAQSVSEGESTRTLATWEDKIDVDFTVTSGHRYLIIIDIMVKSSAGVGESMEFRVDINGTTGVQEADAIDTGHYISYSFAYEVVATASTLEVLVRYARDDGGTAYIKNARARIWKIAES